MEVPDDIAAVIKACLLAIFRGDLAALQRVSLPHPDLAQIVAGRTPPPGIEDEVENVQLHLMNDGQQRAIVHTYFRSMIMPTALARTPDGWRVDMRYFLAAGGPPTPAMQAARMFMYAVVTADLELLVQVAQPHADLGQLIGPRPPSGEFGQLQHVCEEMPVIELRAGETFDSLGDSRTVSEAETTGDRRVVMGIFSGAEVPFLARQAGDRWVIDPGFMIEMMKRSR